MEPRSAYRLQIMEKLGAPLLAALPVDMNGDKAAETLAALIGKAVQAGLQLSQAMKLSEDAADADSVRLSLAAIAAPLLGQSYKEQGKMPDDAAVEKIVKALEAALVFSENFTPAIEHTARLKSLHQPLPVIDTAQTALLSLNALVPAIRAVKQFSFGQSEPALVKEIGERLQQSAKQVSQFATGGEAGDQAFGQLILLRAMAELYEQAQARVLQQFDGDDAPDIAAVWAAYDEQVAMMAALSGAAVPQAGSGSQQGPAPAQEKAAKDAPAKPSNPMGFFKKGEEQPAAVPPPENEPQAAPPQQSSPPSSSGGPMSFFKPGAGKASE